MLLIEIFEKAVERENAHFDRLGLDEKIEIICSDVFHPVAVMKCTFENTVKYNLYTLNYQNDLLLIRTFKSLETATNALHALAVTEK